MKLKFFISIVILVPILVNAMSQEQWNAYSLSQAQVKQAEQSYQFMQNLERERKEKELEDIEKNRLHCDRSKMSQLEELKASSICTSSNNQNFEKRYLKCTLIQENCDDISLRTAKTINKADLNLILLETKAMFNEYSYDFKCTGDDVDIYKSYSKPIVFLNKKNQFILYNSHYSISDKENLSIYQCKKATFFEKMKMKIDE